MCTGLPPSAPLRPTPARVYPRVYGATRLSCVGGMALPGLSPCVRGYLTTDASENETLRSIPVCTGLPARCTGRGTSGRVYPRVYGATTDPARRSAARRGLSPCVRGYRGETFIRHAKDGSIPVCTGLPLGHLDTTNLRRVYPRVYGATYYPVGLQVVVDGSIPVCTGLPLLQSVTAPAWKERFPSFYPSSASLCRRKGWAAARYVLAHRYLK